MNYRSLLCLAFVALLLTSCGSGGERAAMLDRADSLMSVSPAQALDYTDSLISAGEGGSHFQSQLQLRRLNAKNKLDTVFTRRHVDEAKSLVEHFDRHGTPNERMLAHYLLGRTYADTHEAPMALEAYQDAIDCADTTATDCDYYQLCRVCSQMANIFYRQGLYHEDLSHLDLAVHYAYLSNDTIGALLSYGQKIGVYKQLLMGDSALYVSKAVSSQFRSLGSDNMAAAFLAPAISELVSQGQSAEAKRYMDIYESESGYFDKDHNIEKGREVYYHIKGRYYLITHQYDSAEYYFRKELRDGRDFNNQNCGSAGLAQLFYQTHRPDSAFKYAMYSHEMCDSFYAQRATDAVAQTKELYDYSRHQREAQQEKERAAREREKFRYGVIVAVLAAIVVGSAVWRQRKRQKAAYQKAMSLLASAQNDILNLKSHEADLRATIAEKEKHIQESEDKLATEQSEMEELRQKADALSVRITEKERTIESQKAILEKHQQRERLTTDSAERLINNSDIYQVLKKKVDYGQSLTDDEWQQLTELIIEALPGFYSLLSSKMHALNILDYQVCVLDRLHVGPRQIHHMLGISEAYASRIRTKLHTIFFNEEGTGKDFDQKIRKIY